MPVSPVIDRLSVDLPDQLTNERGLHATQQFIGVLHIQKLRFHNYASVQITGSASVDL